MILDVRNVALLLIDNSQKIEHSRRVDRVDKKSQGTKTHKIIEKS